jgi:hypothetical protein
MKLRLSLLPAIGIAAIALVGQAFGQADPIITAWTFQNYAPPPTVPPYIIHPLPTTGSGTASPLGMNNGYTYTFSDGGTTVGSNDGEDTILTPGSSTNSSTDVAWRIRGTSNKEAQGPGTGNGWNTAAPQYTQGAEFDVSTVGFNNIVFKYDWFTTNQGVTDQQAEYTTNGSTWNLVGALQVATPNGFNNGITIDFNALGIHTVDNDAAFGIRLVSAYDPTYHGAGAPTYTGASGGVYNNNSGNWRFDNVIVSGNTIPTPEPASVVLAGVGLVGLLFYGWRRRRAA